MKKFKLDNEPKIETGFKVPEEYFSTLTDKVMEQLPLQEPKVIPLYKRRPVWLSAAAVFALLLGISVFINFNTKPALLPDDNAIENYLVYQANIGTYELYQKLDDDDIAELEQSITLNNKAIESYISDQNNYDIYLTE